MNRIRLFFATALAVALLGVGFASSPALAITYFSPVTTFEDDSLDWLVRSGAVVTPAPGVTINVGDRLVGVLEFNQTTGILAGQGPALLSADGQELTGVFDITVVAKIANGANFDFIFGPTAGSTFVDSSVAGTMASLYLDSTPNLNVINGTCGTLAQCVAAASDSDTGDVYLNVGFNGDPNEAWVAIDAPDDINSVFLAAATSTEGDFNYFLNILTNNTGLNFGPQNCAPSGCPAGADNSVQVIGSGNILGGQGLTNGAFGRDDTDAQVAPIPEPSTLLLLGGGFLGLAFISRRRRNK